MSIAHVSRQTCVAGPRIVPRQEHATMLLRRSICALALLLAALLPSMAQAENSLGTLLRKAWDRGVSAAAAQDSFEVVYDADTPQNNAVMRMSGCSGALITPTLVLTVGHCSPREAGGPDEPHPDCRLLSTQARLAGYPWASPYAWRPLTKSDRIAEIGLHRSQPKMRIAAVAVSLPRCADMALYKLARAVPASVATPLPIMTHPPLNANRTFGNAELRYAGYGMAAGLRDVHPYRQTGRVRYWGVNTCFVAALPPLRRSGQRIVSGDSGAPLLVKQGDREVVAGVLWGSGGADPITCGTILPRLPRLHGLYTPTYRPQIPGTGATDIGDWLRTMAPEAEHL